MTTEQRLDRIEAVLEQIAQQQQTNTAAINQLTAQQNQLTLEVDALVETVSSMVTDAEAARQEAAADRQAWQAEIQRIWQYLLQQGGNGRNSGA